MIQTRVFSGQIDDSLAERIIEFDRQNMQATLDQAGVVFPEENRRKGFESNPTLIVAFERDEIVGYIEYLRTWNDRRYIYIIPVIEKWRSRAKR